MTCEHQNKNTFIRDIFIIIGLIFAFFMFREIFTWFTKNNHTLAVVTDNQTRLLLIEKMLLSLTS